jgi:hypothetical protein
MNEQELLNLYNWVKNEDNTYEQRYSFDVFKSKMQDEEYASKLNEWVGNRQKISSNPLVPLKKKVGTSALPEQQVAKPMASPLADGSSALRQIDDLTKIGQPQQTLPLVLTEKGKKTYIEPVEAVIDKNLEADRIKFALNEQNTQGMINNMMSSGDPKKQADATVYQEKLNQYKQLLIPEKQKIQKQIIDQARVDSQQNILSLSSQIEDLKSKGVPDDSEQINILNTKLYSEEIKPVNLVKNIFTEQEIEELGASNEDIVSYLEFLRESSPDKYESLVRKSSSKMLGSIRIGNQLTDEQRAKLVNDALQHKSGKVYNDYTYLKDSGVIDEVNKNFDKYSELSEKSNKIGEYIDIYERRKQDGILTPEDADKYKVLLEKKQQIDNVTKGFAEKLNKVNDVRESMDQNAAEWVKANFALGGSLDAKQKAIEAADENVKNNPVLGRANEIAKYIWNNIVVGVPKSLVDLGAMIGGNIIAGGSDSENKDENRKNTNTTREFMSELFDKITFETAESPSLDEKGDVIWSNIPNNTASTLATMAGLFAGGGIVSKTATKLGAGAKVAPKIGSLVSSFALTRNDYYKEYLDAGMTIEQASKYADGAAALTSVLELVSPNDAAKSLLSGVNLRKGFVTESAKYFSDKGFKYSMRKGGEFLLKEIGAENVQEMSQAIGDIGVKYIANQNANKEIFNLNMEDFYRQAKETALLTTLSTGILGGVSVKGQIREQKKQYTFDAAMNYDAFMSNINNVDITEDEKNKVIENVAEYKKAIDSLPDEMKEDKKRDITPALVRKNRLEAIIKNDGLDDVFKDKAKADLVEVIDVIKKYNSGDKNTKISLVNDDPSKPLFGKEEVVKKEEAKPTTNLAQQYIESINKAKTDSPNIFWAVDLPFQKEDGTIDEEQLKLAESEGRLIKTEAGFGVVSKDGDIKGVFKSDLASTEKTGDQVIKAAIKAGGIKLDNFALPNLMKIYQRNGFRVVSRLPFNEEVAPEGWNKEEHGTPDVVAMVYDPENKLDIEEKQFQDYSEAMAYRDSFVDQTAKMESDFKVSGLEQVTPTTDQGIALTNKSSVENLKSKTKNSTKVKIIESAQRAVKTLQSVLPNFDIIMHDDEGSYNAAMKDRNGLQGSVGNFSYSTNDNGDLTGRIDINLSKANARTVAHEVAHGIMLKAFGDNPALFKNFRDRISTVLKESSNKALMDFADQYDGEVAYEEYLAELTGALAAQEGKLSPTTLQKIATIINDIVSKLTNGKLKPFENIKDTKQVIEFFNTISESIRTGADVDLKNTISNEGIEENIKTPISKSQKQDEQKGKIPAAGNRLFNEPLKEAKEIADRYYKRVFGKERAEFNGTRKLDKERAKRISDAFIAMKNDPRNPRVIASYSAMAKETIDQYKDFLNSGYVVEINNQEPYDNSQAVIEDLRANKRIKIFSTESGFGDTPITDKLRKENPLLADSGYKDVNGEKLLINDVFRAVHDFFGHAELGNSFGPLGEENAWNVHARMYSPLARKAVTTETRGQNSYVNFSGVNEEIDKMRAEARRLRDNGDEKGAKKIVDDIYEKGSFAEQKIGLLPDEFSEFDTDIDDNQILQKDFPLSKSQVDLFNTSKSQKSTNKQMIDFIKKSRSQGISEENIKNFLIGKGFTAQEVDDIMSVEKGANIKTELSEELLPGYDRLMDTISGVIDKSQNRGVAFNKVIDNAMKYLMGSKVYKDATDVQREMLVRDLNKMFDLKQKSAPSVGKILGTIKDITKITLSEKELLKLQIKDLARGAKDANDARTKSTQLLTKEIKELRLKGKVSVTQLTNILRRFSKVNMFDNDSISSFVDYMVNVFENADYANTIEGVRAKLSQAKKNIKTKIGIGDGLIGPLTRLFSMNPTIIPDSVLEDYVRIVDMLGARAAVLNLTEKNQLINDVQLVLDAVDNQQSVIDELIYKLDQSENKLYDDNGKLEYADTVKLMLEKGEISKDEAALMMKFKSLIVQKEEKVDKTDAEIQEERDEIIDGINGVVSDIESSSVIADLATRDERKLASDLIKLVKSNLIDAFSNTQLKTLSKVLENISNGYVTNLAEMMREDLESVGAASIYKKALNKAKLLKISKMYSDLKAFIIRKSGKGTFEMIRRNPLFFVDQLLGDYKSRNVFESLFEKPAKAADSYRADLKKVQNILDKALERVAKSFKLDGNKTLMSSYKITTYLTQLEYLSNKGSDQVNKAYDYLKETIKFIESENSTFGERDVEMLQDILDNFSKGQDIDIDKLYNSFNKAEKAAIKQIRDLNDSLQEKAEFTAAIIRGDKIKPLSNYIHTKVLLEQKPNDTQNISESSDINSGMKPSTKAKNLIERTKGAKPIDFNIFSTAERGAKFTLLDYHLTPAIRTSRKTINRTLKDMESEGRIPKEVRKIKNAIDSAFEEAVSNLINNSVMTSSLADMIVDLLNKNGYRSILAGTGRFANELISNIGFAVVTDPKALATGISYRDIIMSPDGVKVIMNLNTTQGSRLFNESSLSGRVIDTEILNQAAGIRNSKAKNSVANKIQQIWDLSGKKVSNSVAFIADALISTPDKLIMRPLWFGAFANEFKKLTGEEVDFGLIAANDEAYMNKYKDSLSKATKLADERSVAAGATDNPFMGILKGTQKPNQSPFIRAFNNFNNFMSKFLIYEYITARTGIMAAMGNGSISKQRGVALLAGVTTRMIVYSTLTHYTGAGLIGLISSALGYDDDEPEEEEKSFLQTLGQATVSAGTGLFLGRDFGNATKSVINYGVEKVNENYLDALRVGEYDPYKDAIQYTIIPADKKGAQTGLFDLVKNLGGASGPALKTADLIVKNIFAEPKKEAGAIQRQSDERNIRIPLELLGNAGYIPFYKEIRTVVLEDIYKSIKQEQIDAANKKQQAIDKLGGYKNMSDMKRYDPDLYDRTFGENSVGYDERQAIKNLKKAERDLERQLEDVKRGYSKPEKTKKSSWTNDSKPDKTKGSSWTNDSKPEKTKKSSWTNQ